MQKFHYLQTVMDINDVDIDGIQVSDKFLFRKMKKERISGIISVTKMIK